MIDDLIARWSHLSPEEKARLQEMLDLSSDPETRKWVEKKEKEDALDTIKDIRRQKYEMNYVDYDLTTTKEDDEEYYSRGRVPKREREVERKTIRLDRRTEQDAEMHGAFMAVSGILGLVCLYYFCGYCYQRAKGEQR